MTTHKNPGRPPQNNSKDIMKFTPTYPISLPCFVLCLFGLSASVAAPPSDHAAEAVPFHATYTLDLEMAVIPPIASITSSGSALATHLGRVAARSVEETVNLATGEGVATHEFTAANGDVILVDFIFTAIPTSPTLFTVTGSWEISDGTGRFQGASGSGSYEGQVDFTTPITANASFTMEGSISSPGSVK
jgi:hypothetical protein